MTYRKLDDFLKPLEIQTINIQPLSRQQKQEEPRYEIVGFYRETRFQETPIGKIPKEWKIVKLHEISDKIKAGGTPRVSKKDYWNGNIPFVKIEDLTTSRKYLYSTKTFITELGLKKSNAWIVPEESLLLAMYGSLGEVAINKIKVATNQAILGIIPRRGITQVEYLYYWFLYYKPKWRIYAKWTTQPNLTAEIVKDSYISLPPLKEQWGIAEVLSSFDQAIEATERLIEKLEQVKKVLMQELLMKGIGHKEFKDTEIGRIPKDWEVVKLKSIGEFQYGITASATKKDTGLKLLRITDITDEGIKWEEVPYCDIAKAEFDKYELKVGDVLFARIGATTGKTCYIDRTVKAVFGSYLIRFKPKIQLNSQFLYFYTQSPFYWNQVNRVKEGQLKKGLNTKTLGHLLLILPPISEQQRIAEILSTVDKKLEIERKRKEKLERIKKALMDLFLTGKIRVKVS